MSLSMRSTTDTVSVGLAHDPLERLACRYPDSLCCEYLYTTGQWAAADHQSYVCYCPRSLMSEKDLQTKVDVFNKRKGTTHWPQQNRIPVERQNYPEAKARRPDGSLDPNDRDRPFVEPKETPEVLRLVGIRA
jgi:hypothetical protein